MAETTDPVPNQELADDIGDFDEDNWSTIVDRRTHPDDYDDEGDLKPEARARRRAEEERQLELSKQPYFAPGADAKHPIGVLYQGEFETPTDGTARAVRLHARALAATGVPLMLRSFSQVVTNGDGVVEPVYVAGMPPEVQAEVGHLLDTDIAAFRPVIKHVVIRSPEHLRQLLMPKGAIPLDAGNIEEQVKLRDDIYASTIVYSVWERDRIDEGIARALARVKQCWVPCEQNRQLLIGAGVPEASVHVVPHPYEPGPIEQLCSKRPPGMHQGWRRFYAIGRWEPRKGFDKLLRAFVRAFKPADKVSLVIKYSGSGNWQDYPTPEQALTDAIDGDWEKCPWKPSELRARVTLIGGRVKESQITKLHFQNNIYVSSSHGEAFNFGAFDAKRAGNALVYIPWGGVCDFAEASDISVPHVMKPAHASYRWEHGAEWADYSVEALAEGLQRAQIPDAFQPPPALERDFSLEAVGRKMRLLVDSAAPKQYPSSPPLPGE